MPPKTFGQFVMGIFSEADGNPSFSRLLSFLAFLFVMAIYAAQFVKTGQPPAGLDLLEAMMGASSPYALNRVGRGFTKPQPIVQPVLTLRAGSGPGETAAPEAK